MRLTLPSVNGIQISKATNMLHFLVPLLTLLAQRTSAHGGALNYTVGDIWYPGYDPYSLDPTQDSAPWMVQRKWITNVPIFEANNISLACNFPGNSAHASIPIIAGQNITAVYGYWVHTVGPMVAWMADCGGDCRDFNAADADWFKIGEKGLLSGTVEEGMWFQREFSNWNGGPSLWSENVPVSLRPGAYLIRHEIISLHR